jgi:sulfur carrier protein
VKVRVNGEQRELSEGSCVLDVLNALGGSHSGVAVALNGTVVPRASWEQTRLVEGAVVEVLTAVQGG